MSILQDPPITLFHLPGARSIRIAWLLEELNLPYTVEVQPRDSNFGAPTDLRAKMGAGLGRVPMIHDRSGGKTLAVQESGAIAE